MSKNIVIIAAGGGNDVFSTIAYVKSVITDHSTDNIGIISMLGLTPFHRSDTNILIEQRIIIPNDNMERYIMCNPSKKIRCMERLLPVILKDIAPNINKYACLSPKYSAISQANELDKLLSRWNMYRSDMMIMLVDFGGDILTNGKQSSIISPELDAFSLALCHNMVKLGYQSKLTVCFPGVDGELPADYLTDIINAHSIETIPVDTDKWMTSLNSIYPYVKAERSGNTIPNMLEILGNPSLNAVNLQKTWRVGSLSLKSKFKFPINPNLQSRLYVFDLPIWNPFVNIFQTENFNLKYVIDSVLKIYGSQEDNLMQSSDLHLQYISKDSIGDWTNRELDIPSDVMLIDIFPKCIANHDINICRAEIINMTTYSTLYSTTQ
jgi:hypothetical protein